MKTCASCSKVVDDAQTRCPNCSGLTFVERAQTGSPVGGATSICERCGHIGAPEKRIPGSTAAQVTLFVLGLITFGVVLIVWAAYVIWRLVKTEVVCPSCGAPKTMVALDSPLGRSLKARFAEGAVAPASTHDAGTKQCPYCAETIKREAKLCRYCGKDLGAQVA